MSKLCRLARVVLGLPALRSVSCDDFAERARLERQIASMKDPKEGKICLDLTKVFQSFAPGAQLNRSPH
jgi:hypothetical protein